MAAELDALQVGNLDLMKVDQMAENLAVHMVASWVDLKDVMLVEKLDSFLAERKVL